MFSLELFSPVSLLSRLLGVELSPSLLFSPLFSGLEGVLSTSPFSGAGGVEGVISSISPSSGVDGGGS